MILVIALLVFAIAILLGQLNYKNHCVKDLKKALSDLRKTHVADVMKMLYELKDAQDKATITTTHDAEVKRILNNYIAKYSQEDRYFGKRDFEELLKKACEERKKELNEYIHDDNV